MNQDVLSNRHIKFFFYIIFRHLGMNINFNTIIENMYNIEDEFGTYFWKNMIVQVIQQIFCDMLILGRKIVNNGSFFEGTNIRENVQYDFSELERLLLKIVSKKPFMNQEISYIMWNFEEKLFTVSTYIKAIFSIIEIENKNFTCVLNGMHQLN